MPLTKDRNTNAVIEKTIAQVCRSSLEEHYLREAFACVYCQGKCDGVELTAKSLRAVVTESIVAALP